MTAEQLPISMILWDPAINKTEAGFNARVAVTDTFLPLNLIEGNVFLEEAEGDSVTQNINDGLVDKRIIWEMPFIPEPEQILFITPNRETANAAKDSHSSVVHWSNLDIWGNSSAAHRAPHDLYGFLRDNFAYETVDQSRLRHLEWIENLKDVSRNMAKDLGISTELMKRNFKLTNLPPILTSAGSILTGDPLTQGIASGIGNLHGTISALLSASKGRNRRYKVADGLMMHFYMADNEPEREMLDYMFQDFKEVPIQPLIDDMMDLDFSNPHIRRSLTLSSTSALFANMGPLLNGVPSLTGAAVQIGLSCAYTLANGVLIRELAANGASARRGEQALGNLIQEEARIRKDLKNPHMEERTVRLPQQPVRRLL